jgi:hypothetical protein
VVILQGYSGYGTSYSVGYNFIVMLNGTPAVIYGGGTYGYSYPITVSWLTKGVKWSADRDATAQANASAKAYLYMAVG